MIVYIPREIGDIKPDLVLAFGLNAEIHQIVSRVIRLGCHSREWIIDFPLFIKHGNNFVTGFRNPTQTQLRVVGNKISGDLAGIVCQNGGKFDRCLDPYLPRQLAAVVRDIPGNQSIIVETIGKQWQGNRPVSILVHVVDAHDGWIGSRIRLSVDIITGYAVHQEVDLMIIAA